MGKLRKEIIAENRERLLKEYGTLVKTMKELGLMDENYCKDMDGDMEKLGEIKMDGLIVELAIVWEIYVGEYRGDDR